MVAAAVKGAFTRLGRALTSWPVGVSLAALTYVDEVEPPHFISPTASAAFGGFSIVSLAVRGVTRVRLVTHGANVLVQGWKLMHELAPAQETPLAEGQEKTRVVILGSGWGAMSFIKNLSFGRTGPKGMYDITVVSPRGHFLYTPLLPGAVTGTVEQKSIMESVRYLMRGKGKFYEAICTEVDPVRKVVKCSYPKPFKNAGDVQPNFELPYDVLIVGVGAVVNTFNTPGVQENAYFLKEMEDASALRTRVRECFELAALPDTPSETKKNLLTFVVVGGGPTGVETAAEIHDLVEDDLSTVLESLTPLVSIKVVETRDHILSMYDKQISQYTEEHFKREGIDLLLNKMVLKVEPGGLMLKEMADGTSDFLPARTVVWCTGIKLNPLAVSIMDKLGKDAQGNARAIRTDGYLQVKGSSGSIFAMGDTATIEQENVLQHAEKLFAKADADKNGLLCCAEIRQLMREASHRYPQLSLMEAEFDCLKEGAVAGFLSRLTALTAAEPPDSVKDEGSVQFTMDQFKEKLEKIDKSLRSLPATAQVANQEGRYLAELFNKFHVQGEAQALPEDAPAFKYKHLGAFAYVGADKAVMEMALSDEKPGVFAGWFAGLAWKGFESFQQMSARTKYLVSRDWIKAKVFGRDWTE